LYAVAKRLSADTASSDASAESRAITGPQLVQFFFRRLVSLNFITCQQLRPGHAVHLSRTEDCPSARLSKSDHLRPLSCTKRIRKKIVLTVEQYPALLAELPYHIQVMVMIAMCLGLRISEIRALQRQDFDLKGRMLTLARSIVGRYVWNGGKTGASEDEVALDSSLVSVLEDWRKRCIPTPEGWLFANVDTKRPVHGDAIQKDYLRPAGQKIGLQGVVWHAFRHTYRTLIDDVGTPLGVQQRLMRHADIKTTMNTYGSAFEKSKRRANSRVAALVLPPAIKRQLKDKAKDVSLQNLRPETAAIQ